MAIRTIRLVAAVLVLAALNACGGGGGSPPPPPATHFAVTPSSATAVTGVGFTVTVAALDAAGNVVTSYTGSVRLSSSDGAAVLPAPAPLAQGQQTFSVTMATSGLQTISATDTVSSSITGQSQSIAVTGPATHLLVTAPATALAGASLPITVTALDASNNTATSYNGSVLITSSDGQALLPAAAVPFVSGAGAFNATLQSIGTQTLTATDTVQASIAGTSAPIAVSTPPPPVIATLPGPQGATLNQPYSYQFQVSGFAPIAISETGALPPGLAPLTATGLLAGTPTSANLYPITVHAIDAAGQDTPQAFTIRVFQHGFAPTGGMQAMRAFHTATLLASGQVLVTGGASISLDNGILTSSELFTPTSGSFAATAALQVARDDHTATLLCDLAALPCTNPKVLVVGGNAGATVVSGAELYDPMAGTFTLTGSLATARGGHTATRLLSGKVLIVGGRQYNPSSLASAELFDPATGTFSATAAPMASARYRPTATLLPDGRVLIAGGLDYNSGYLNSAELFDPVTTTFSTIPSPMTAARYGHTATLLPGGKVLIAGGLDSSGASLAAAELYDPAAVAPAASFTATGALVTPRRFHAAVLLPSGQVLLAGGRYQRQELQHAELYDPASGLFASTGGMQTARIYHTLTSLGSSGTVLVVGGYNNGNTLNTAEVYQ